MHFKFKDCAVIILSNASLVSIFRCIDVISVKTVGVYVVHLVVTLVEQSSTRPTICIPVLIECQNSRPIATATDRHEMIVAFSEKGQ